MLNKDSGYAYSYLRVRVLFCFDDAGVLLWVLRGDSAVKCCHDRKHVRVKLFYSVITFVEYRSLRALLMTHKAESVRPRFVAFLHDHVARGSSPTRSSLGLYKYVSYSSITRS